jgi:amino acid adenylation domain-containing protein
MSDTAHALERLRRVPAARRAELIRGADGDGRGQDGPARLPRAPGEPLPLSLEQEQLWLLHVSQEQSHTTYHLPWAFTIEGPLNTGAFAAALAEISRRHTVLRSVFRADAEGPVQVVEPVDLTGLLRTVDLSGLGTAAEEAASRCLADEAVARFDLERGPLARATLLRLAPDRHVVAWSANELVFDRPSLGLLLDELVALYETGGRRRPAAAQPALAYSDYAAWQRRWVDGPEADGMRRRWSELLAGYGGIELPFERTYSLYNRWLTSDGAVLSRPWPEELVAATARLARRLAVEPLVVLEAAHAALLHRHNGQPDFCLGLEVDNRPPEAARVIGNFENLLPVRVDLGGDPTFTELVGRVSEASREARANQRLPYSRILEVAQADQGSDRLPLLMTAIKTGPARGAVDLGDGVVLEVEPLHDGTARLDLAIDVVADAAESRAVVEYSSKLFSPESVDLLLGRLALLLGEALREPDERVSRLPIATPDELRAVVRDWNDTALPDAPATIPERFDAQAARTPGNVAVTDESGLELTYDELRRRANRLAHALRAQGLGHEDRCALFLERTAAIPVAVLGVLKGGGAYVPLDPETPAERLEAILRDADVSAVVSDGALADTVPDGPWRVVRLDEAGALRARPDDDPAAPISPASLAYVMYTSGSTGRPKGVLIEHGSVCAFVRGAQELYGLTADDRFVQLSSLAFDVSTFDLFASLCTGARVCIASSETRRSVHRVRELLRAQRATVYMGTPGLLELLDPADFPDLRVVAVGGESYSGEFTSRWAAGRRFVNSYGPTETTVGVVTKDCEGAWDASPPIGRAMANHRAYVLDPELRPLPVGVPGELYVGGPGVGRGYLGRPGLTAAAFPPDPYAPAPGGRLYRTGDLARWLPSGDLLFVGRADRQVKVSGVRIELSEIESALRRHPSVEQVVVSAEDGEGDGLTRLVAYVVTADSSPPGASSLRASVASWLPPNMIPHEFVYLDALPLAASGKLDLAALEEARRGQREAGRESVVGPRTETERAVAEEILGPVLGRDVIGVDENFFELGGQSLQVLSVLGRVRARFGVEIRVAQFFQVPTLAGIAGAIDAGRNDVVARADRDALLEALAEVEQLDDGAGAAADSARA